MHNLLRTYNLANVLELSGNKLSQIFHLSLLHYKFLLLNNHLDLTSLLIVQIHMSIKNDYRSGFSSGQFSLTNNIIIAPPMYLIRAVANYCCFIVLYLQILVALCVACSPLSPCPFAHSSYDPRSTILLTKGDAYFTQFKMEHLHVME